MSVADYETALPGVYHKRLNNGPGRTENDTETKPGKESGGQSHRESYNKGFADIIEFRKAKSDGGYSVQVIPAARFIPKGFKTTGKEKEYADHALVLRRTVLQSLGSQSVRFIRIELEIQPPVLCEALRRLVRNLYEDSDFQVVPIKLRFPFYELFFYYKEIRELAEKQDTEHTLRGYVQLLVDFIRRDGPLSNIIEDYDRHTPDGQIPANILWTVYPPNSLVVLNNEPIQECWMVRNVEQVVDEKGTYWWEVSGFRLGCDGEAPGFVRQRAIVARVGMALLTISELNLVPIQLYRDWATLEPILRARAETVRRVLGNTLCNFRAQTYAGMGWEGVNFLRTYGLPVGPFSRANAKQLDERVMIDIQTFIHSDFRNKIGLEDLRGRNKPQTQQGTVKRMRRPDEPWRDRSDCDCEDPDCETCLASRKGRPEDTPGFDVHEMLGFKLPAHRAKTQNSQDIDYSPKDLEGLARTSEATLSVPQIHFSLLYPALLPAFGLKSKKWHWVLSDRLQDVEWSKTAFESLQLNPTAKNLLQSLIRGHKDSVKSGFDDVVTGKGQGLIFLLHGGTGLGKTLTAEGIADYLQRPLYSISGGELSVDVSQAENRLDKIFELAKRWDAVSLLDEADVLLCKRNSAEMQRNAIVGVFLRKLEYFQGVLFLTTNRKQDFDQAFKSRIHVTISYPPLDAAAQSAIWRDLIHKNIRAGVKTDKSWSKGVFGALGGLNLNGRIIKNILRTAVAYASAEDDKLSARHVLAILQTELMEGCEGLNVESLTSDETRNVEGAQRALGELRQLLEGDADGEGLN